MSDTEASVEIKELTDANFEVSVGMESMPLLVDFWADWCGPCKGLSAELEVMAVEQADKLKIAKVNVDDAPMTVVEHEVLTMPTMILFKDGEKVAVIPGAHSKDKILEFIGEFL